MNRHQTNGSFDMPVSVSLNKKLQGAIFDWTMTKSLRVEIRIGWPAFEGRPESIYLAADLDHNVQVSRSEAIKISESKIVELEDFRENLPGKIAPFESPI